MPPAAAEPAGPAGLTTGRLGPFEAVAALALATMVVVPVVEVAARPLLGTGVQNASVLVQHLGLVMAMFGAVAAQRSGHLGTLGGERHHPLPRALAALVGALVCALLAQASASFVDSERAVAHGLAYGVPVWWVQAAMPLGFAALSARLALCLTPHPLLRWGAAVAVPAFGWWLATQADAGPTALAWPLLVLVGAALFAGMPIFAALGGLGLWLFWHDGLPLASVVLSHYQITVNPSLPALPLFTLAGLVFARTGAAQRLGRLFVALFGGGPLGTALAATVMCSAFTAFTGGSGVTILALGGLLLPLLKGSGYPQTRAIGLVTSASALGVLLAPSVPLVLYAVLARVPIVDMFIAGAVPALLMIVCLLVVGGFLRGLRNAPADRAPREPLLPALWAARWELAAPVVALGALTSGLTTPTESAAITAAYVLLTRALAHRELGWQGLAHVLADAVKIIGGVMLILGMALALTNWLIDAGIPDAAVDWVTRAIPDRTVFLFALCAFLVASAALMEIYAALVVLVPLLLPVARSYGIDPVHFGIIFLAAMEAGFLFPPAGMNLYFASAMFRRPLREVARACLPAMLSIVVGTLAVALLPALSTGLLAWWR